jgi:secondary thiamine-phosphate synthase enzyme
MKIFSDKISFNTKGNCEIVDITRRLADVLEKSKIKDGILNAFVSGATGAITTIEYEPGLVCDFQNLLKEIVKENKDYEHNKTHPDNNATSHLRASLLGPSLSVPVENGNMILGRWQQIVFVDMDNRSRERTVTIKIIGE